MSADDVRTYEGRPLPRPDEEVVDQGLAFDVGTLLSRRQALRALGVGAAAVGLAACGGTTSAPAAQGSPSASTSAGAVAAGLTEIPDETAGPFPGDGSNGPNVLTDEGVVRSDIRSSFGDASGVAAGVPVTVELTVRDLANGGSPFAGAALYLWHCDQQGRYSLYEDEVRTENYLRGVQVAGADGTLRFQTVFPGCYDGRWPHMHFEVYPDRASIADSGAVVATSQLALPKDLCDTVYATSGYEASTRAISRVSLTGDGVFGEDGGALQLPTVMGDSASGYLLSLVVGVDTRTPARP